MDAATQRRAMNRLNQFFGGSADKYECSWPHVPGARVCQGMFKEHVSPGAGANSRVPFLA
mgnify:CR=1 FL=1